MLLKCLESALVYRRYSCVPCLLHLISSNKATDCGLFLLVRVRGYLWNIAPRRKGVHLELSLNQAARLK